MRHLAIQAMREEISPRHAANLLHAFAREGLRSVDGNSGARHLSTRATRLLRANGAVRSSSDPDGQAGRIQFGIAELSVIGLAPSLLQF